MRLPEESILWKHAGWSTARGFGSSRSCKAAPYDAFTAITRIPGRAKAAIQ